MKTYKVKLEDKAALLNRLEKAGVAVDSQAIKDIKLEGYFEITFSGDEDLGIHFCIYLSHTPPSCSSSFLKYALLFT